MKIGKITINSKLALAPMAGVTDLGFRTVCRELGAGYTVTEMVSAIWAVRCPRWPTPGMAPA